MNKNTCFISSTHSAVLFPFLGTLTLAFIAVIICTAAAFPSSVAAHHAWENHHWARTTRPLTLQFGDSVTANWEPYLNRAVMDWNRSSVLDVVVVPGKANPKGCKSSFGRAEVCNAEYGETGWLGVVHIWVSNGHIIHAAVKINDTYFNRPEFNTPAWKYLIMCHEIGHALGLSHQDTDLWNAPLGTCMDYSEDPAKNQRPNAHDYEALEAIYAHVDASAAATSSVFIYTSPLTIEELKRPKLSKQAKKPSLWQKAVHAFSKELN